MDKQLLNARQQDVILVGGAEPCPLLGLRDFVLVRVRTHHGPHPSSSNGSCDYYVPGIVNALPDDIRKGHAIYTVLVFNGKSLTCPRRGIIKINKSRYSRVSKYIKEMLTHPSTVSPGSCSTSLRSQSHSTFKSSSLSNTSKSSSHSNTSKSSSHSNTSKSSSHLNTSKSSSHSIPPSCVITVRVPTAQDSSPMSSCDGGSTWLLTPTPTLQTRSHSASTSEKEIKSDFESKAHRTGRHSRSKAGSKSDMQQLLKLQKVQEALLGQQSRELSAMQLQQEELKCELRTRREEDMRRKRGEAGRPHSLRNGVHDEGKQTRMNGGEGVSVTSTVTTPVATPTWIASYLPPAPGTPIGAPWPRPTAPEQCPQNALYAEVSEQATNTEPWTEEKGVGTDPLTESRAVGTEWSESGLDSSTETDDFLASTPCAKTSPSSSIHLQEVVEEDDWEDPLVNQHVLARWPDDGWYYRGMVKRSVGEMWYEVSDAGQDIETIHALDIIIDLQDGQRPLEVGETVAALHPSYDRSYAPGTVVGIVSGLYFSVELYDKSKVHLPRHEVYHLAQAKHHRDVEYLRDREAAWVGLAIMARRDMDGLYLPGIYYCTIQCCCVMTKKNSTALFLC